MASIQLGIACRREADKPAAFSEKNLQKDSLAIRSGFNPRWILNWPDPQELANDWEVLPGNDFNRPALISTQLKKLTISPTLIDWPTESLLEYTFVAKFELEPNELKTPGNWGLWLGGLIGNRQIFINGNLIHAALELSPDGKRVLKQQQVRGLLLEIDRTFLRPGQNLIAFRLIGDRNTDDLGLYPGNPFLIAKYSSLIQKAFEFPLIALIAIYFVVACYHIILFAGRRKDKDNLYFGIFCLGLIIYYITRSNFVFWFTDNPELVTRIEYASLFLSLIPFLAFIDLIFYSGTTKFTKLYAILVTPLAITALIPGPMRLAVNVLRVWQIGMLVGIVYFIAFHGGRVLYRDMAHELSLQPDGSRLARFLRAMLSTFIHTSVGNLFLGLITILGTAIWDILDSIYFRTGLGLSKYGFTIFILGIAVMLSRRSQRMHSEIEQLNMNLERQIKQEIRLKDSFARFVPTSFLRILGKQSIPDVNLGDYTEKEMTIMFADIRSFTSISEKLTPKQTFDFINSYLQGAGPIIRNHRGFIDKYMGDGIMALFETPEDAIKAALRLQARNSRLNSTIGRSLVAPLKVGIGIHTGHLMLGTIGERQRMDGTVIADAVNLAARIESLTKQYGVSVLVTKDTLNSTKPEGWSARFIDRIAVKGKVTPTDVFEITPAADGQQGALSPDWRRKWETAIDCYFAGQFQRAHELFTELRASASGDKVCSLYINRCQEHIKSPPPAGWNGVTVATAK